MIFSSIEHDCGGGGDGDGETALYCESRENAHSTLENEQLEYFIRFVQTKFYVHFDADFSFYIMKFRERERKRGRERKKR